jgi:hemerythrin
MDQLEIIQRTIQEHHKIRTHIRLVGDAMNDMEAIINLQHADTSWGQHTVQDVEKNMDRLKQTISQLSEGLTNHFGFEEKWLPDVFGQTLMKALILEHDEVRDRLTKYKAAFIDDIKQFTREKLLSYRATIQQDIDDLSGLIESHASREEIVLLMIEKALIKDKNIKSG